VLVALGFFGLCVALVLAVLFRERALVLCQTLLKPLSARLAARVVGMLESFISAVHVGSGWKLLGFFLLTGVYWGLNAAGLGLLAGAFGFTGLTPLMLAVILTIQVVGVMVPAGPGMVGTMQFFTQAGLSLFAAEGFSARGAAYGAGGRIWFAGRGFSRDGGLGAEHPGGGGNDALETKHADHAFQERCLDALAPAGRPVEVLPKPVRHLHCPSPTNTPCCLGDGLCNPFRREGETAPVLTNRCNRRVFLRVAGCPVFPSGRRCKCPGPGFRYPSGCWPPSGRAEPRWPGPTFPSSGTSILASCLRHLARMRRGPLQRRRWCCQLPPPWSRRPFQAGLPFSISLTKP